MAPSTALRAAPAVLLLLGCLARPERAAWQPWGDLEHEARPTLEEIFLEPPVSGEAPELHSLSADGRFALVRWSPQEEAEGPAGAEMPDEEPEEDEPELRLVDVLDPAEPCGIALAELLPPAGGLGDEEELGTVAWTHRGARLAVSRGPDVLLLDPEAGSAAPLWLRALPEHEDGDELGDEEADVEGEGAEREDGEPPAFPKELRVRRLEFAEDDATLRAHDGEELHVLAVPTQGLPPTLAVNLISEAIEPAPGDVQWSRDLTVVFGADPTPTAPPEPGEDGETEPAPAPQVLHVVTGRGVVLAGMADLEWLEQERLSPDGRFVFGAEFDRVGDPEPTIVPDYLTERVTTREGRRRLAKDGPSPFRLWMWRTSSGERVALLADRLTFPAEDAAELSGEPEVVEAAGDGLPEDAPVVDEPPWLRSLGWAPQPEPGSPARLAFTLRSADHRELESWCWSEGTMRRIWRERDEAWLGGPARSIRWHADGRRLLLGSESSAALRSPGRSQLFSLDPEGGPPIQLTELEGELTSFRPLPDGGVLFEGSRHDPARRVVGIVRAEAVLGRARPAPRLFPVPEGWSAGARASRDGARVVFRHERLLWPTELWTADDGGAYPLTSTVPEAFEAIDWIRPRRISVPSADGRTVHAHVYLPPGAGLEPGSNGRRRATIVFVHGAGYLQNVTDSMTRYPLNAMFHSRLAHLGYPVVDVDYRGSAGYGRDFRTDVQYHLGGKDLDDIHLVVDELVGRGLVDPERVGLYGGSYGGFMTMMALFTAPERWSCGAALRSVTDWRTYHPGYTQPRLGRPSTHPEAYERSSPLDLVEGLDDPLLVLHGMVDSNVFAQDSVRLIEALIDGGADFEAMLYPSQGHAFEDGPHWLDEYRRIERFLLEHLGPPLSDPETERPR